MATRKTKTLKPTIVDAPFVDQPQAAAVEEETSEFGWAYLIKGEASWKRWAVAIVAGLAASVAVGYVGTYFVAYTTLAATMASSSTFISTLVYVLGVLITMYAGYRASTFAYIKVFDKTVDRVCASAYDRVTGLFTFGSKVTS
jgi:hypothetical protein